MNHFSGYVITAYYVHVNEILRFKIFIFCRMVAQDEDNAEDIKKKLAVRLLVPAVNIHIILNKNELRYCILEQRNLFLDTKCEN